MALVKAGQGVTDIRGSLGGVYFTRDKSGLHMNRQPRTIKSRSTAQDKQRKAFIAARTFCRLNPDNNGSKDWVKRCVSFNIYRALNDVELETPPMEYQIPSLQAPRTD